LRDRVSKRRRPLMAALEDTALNANSAGAQCREIGFVFLGAVPAVGRATTEENLRQAHGRSTGDVRRYVGGQNDQTISSLIESRAIGHRATLRKAGKDERSPDPMFRGDRVDDASDVSEIVGNGELAILAGHPVGDDPLITCVERMERLYGDHQPPADA